MILYYENKNVNNKWTRIKRINLYKSIRNHYINFMIICLLLFCIYWILKCKINQIFYNHIEPITLSEDELTGEECRVILNSGNTSHRYVINSARTDFVPPKDKLSRFRFNQKEFHYDPELLEDKDLSALDRNE